MAPPVAGLVLRQAWAGVRILLVLTVLVGLAYPLGVTGLAAIAFRDHAEGSLVRRDGAVVGSSLVGQDFADRRDYFHGRPSAAGNGYDPLASGASNLGPTSPDLLAAVEERRAAAAELDGTPPAQVAPDALQASGSGLDPSISPQYAEQQVERVARERGIPAEAVRALVARFTSGRVLGFLGEPRVNVLELNLALDEASPRGQ